MRMPSASPSPSPVAPISSPVSSPASSPVTTTTTSTSTLAEAETYQFPSEGIQVASAGAGPLTLGQEFTNLTSNLIQTLFKTNVNSLAFQYMIYALTAGFFIGSINRIGYCNIPGLQMDRCNNSIITAYALGLLILSIMAYTREPPPKQQNVDFFSYWESWVMIVSGALILIMILSSSLRSTAVVAGRDFGAKTTGIVGAQQVSSVPYYA